MGQTVCFAEPNKPDQTEARDEIDCFQRGVIAEPHLLLSWNRQNEQQETTHGSCQRPTAGQRLWVGAGIASARIRA